MPIRNGTVYCVNHSDTQMVRNSGFNALTTVERTKSGIVFIPTTGIPLVVYSCSECGYIESYAAQKTQFWNEVEPFITGTATTRGIRFEQMVMEALRLDQKLFPQAEILSHVILKSDDKAREIDAIVESQEAAFILEFKQSFSKRSLESAVAQVRNAVDLYKRQAQRQGKNIPVYPVLIVPSETNVPDEVLGVPTLKFDIEKKRFVNTDSFKEWLYKTNWDPFKYTGLG